MPIFYYRSFLNRKSVFIITLIIVLGLFLRLWHFRELFYYAIDEEKAAYITSAIADLKHFPSAGYPSSIGFRQGPLYFYLTSFVYMFFGRHPLYVGYLSVLASVLSMYFIFAILRKISPRTGLLVMFIYAVSYLNVIYERRGWQLSFDSLLILAACYSLLKLINGKRKYIFSLFGVLSLMTNFEVALVNFLPWTLLAFLFFRIKPGKKFVILSLGMILTANISLIIFDLRHDFLNSTYLLNYFIKDATLRIAPNIPLTGQRQVYLAHNLFPSTLARTLYPGFSSDLAVQYANCPQYLLYKFSLTPLLLKTAVVLLIGYHAFYLIKKRFTGGYRWQITFLCVSFIMIHFTATAVYTYVFHGEMAEYYLVPAFTFFFILIGLFLVDIDRFKKGVFMAMLIFSVLNMRPLIAADNSYGFNSKLEAVKTGLKAVSNSTFMVSSFQTCWYSGGFRYLFTYLGKEPARSYMDEYLSEYYTTQPAVSVSKELIFLTPELIGENPPGYETYRSQINKTAQSLGEYGKIEVYIREGQNNYSR